MSYYFSLKTLKLNGLNDSKTLVVREIKYSFTVSLFNFIKPFMTEAVII